ncbi:MAG: hypothetical protein P4L42_02550 [Desulfocapsaceae bacterium]|nr:hypothetical protein [Desulfocapsaceae bacterium]
MQLKPVAGMGACPAAEPHTPVTGMAGCGAADHNELWKVHHFGMARLALPGQLSEHACRTGLAVYNEICRRHLASV